MRLVFKYSHQALEPKVFHLRVLLSLSRYCMQSRGYSGFSCSFSLNPDISLSYRIKLTFSLACNPSKDHSVVSPTWCLGKHLMLKVKYGSTFFSLGAESLVRGKQRLIKDKSGRKPDWKLTPLIWACQGGCTIGPSLHWTPLRNAPCWPSGLWLCLLGHISHVAWSPGRDSFS